MKRLFVLMATLWALTANAQSFTEHVNAHRETSFGLAPADIYHRHIVWLKNGEKMIIELADVTDYTLLRHLDSLLESALADVVFYKDSVAPLEHVRIDYDVKLESDNVLMRFRRYKQDGDVYVKKQNGDMARIKIERDTFRIIIRKPLLEHNSQMHFYDYPVQVTFIMNNYTNLYDLVSDKPMLRHIIDTLATATAPDEYDPDINRHQTTAEYHPYDNKEPLHVLRIEMMQPSDNKKKTFYLSSNK